MRLRVLMAAAAIFLSACGGSSQSPPPAPQPAAASAKNAGKISAPDHTSNWVRPAKDFASTRFSDLAQITTDSVKQLAVTATFSTGLLRGHEAAPLVVGGTMYIVAPFPNHLYALDLTKPGAPLKWKYEPKPLAAAQGLFSANEDAGTASITDVTQNRLVATLAVGIEPEGVGISPDGTWVYVTAETSNTVTAIDTRRNVVAASFMVDPRPRAVAFSPDGALAYVTAEIGGSISIVDVKRHRVVKTVTLPGRAKPVGVVVSPDGQRVYVANGHGNSVSVLDRRGQVLRTIAVGKRPWNLALSRDGARLYTANGVSNDVSVVDTSTGTVLATIKVGDGPWGIALSSRSAAPSVRRTPQRR